MRLLAGLALAAAGLVSISPAQSDDRGVFVTKEQSGDGVRLVAANDHVSEATFILTATLENMDSSVPLPLVGEIREVGKRAICVFTPRDRSKDWKYHYHYVWKYGLRGGVPDPGAVYLLPYPAGEHHVLMQGYRGKFSHQAGSINEFAYDFEMPIGNTVCASRGGVVIGARQDSDVGGASDAFKLSDNYVMIRHSDGTYAEYLHLKKDGVLVSLGDAVTAGQPVGLAGVTGHTTGPHVHLAVFRLVDTASGVERESLPLRMQTGEGVLPELTQGKTY